MIVTMLGGNLLVLMSIEAKNATMANIIEITYPIFTFFLALLIFREVQITIGAAIGGILILLGGMIVLLKG